MTLPLWYFVVWATSALSYAVTAASIALRSAWKRWPGLLAACAQHVLSFAVLLPLCVHPLLSALDISPAHAYNAYLWFYWRNNAFGELLQIWLAIDVLRSLPGARFIPDRHRAQLLLAVTVAGTAAWYFIGGSQQVTAPLATELLLNVGLKCARSAALLTCIVGVLFAGYGFSLTGIRVATGMLVQMLLDLAASMVYASHATHLQKAAVNVAQTVAAIFIAAYWTFAVLNEDKAIAAMLSDSQTAISPVPPTEKAGITA